MASVLSCDFYLFDPDTESPHGYLPGGYHPVHLGDLYHQRYRVIHKLGYGSYSTVWLARDLQSTVQTRYVALKFAVAELTGENDEIKILHHLASRSGAHPGSGHVPTLLDQFKVEGVNGEHDVLVLPVIGPNLETMYEKGPAAIQKSIKSIMYQVALGTSFLHDSGVVHGDLCKTNITFEIPDLDGKSEKDVLTTLGWPKSAPLFTQDQSHQTELLPKYLVRPAKLEKRVKLDDPRIKIIGFGGAFFSGEIPRELRSPWQIWAPEIMFNKFSTPSKIKLGKQIDVWSFGCVVYQLATSIPLLGGLIDEDDALYVLTLLLGPLPEEWEDSIGPSYSSNAREAPENQITFIGSEIRHITLKQLVQSLSAVDDTPELIKLLKQILVFDPLQRSEVADILHHPWFTVSSSPATSTKAPAERQGPTGCIVY